jgi:glycine oxidase
VVTRYNRGMGQPRTIAIAGGGVIGLACALALAVRSHSVTVYEAGEAAREASWAAGGMLAADDPENPPALLELSRYSRSLYPEFLHEIESLSGQRVPLRTEETIQVLERGHAMPAGRRLSREEARRLVPGIAEEAGDLYLLAEHSMDPRELGAALKAAAIARGVRLEERTPLLGIQPGGPGLLLECARGPRRADALVNACGAWAGMLGGEPARAEHAIVPVKGQMMAVAQPAEAPLTRVLRSPGVYLIPRDRTRLVIGATVEQDGFSKEVRESGLRLLRERAAALWPPAAAAPLLESWAGLRPGTPDALPVLGACDDGGARWLAGGHYRNGILLAPATGRIIADLLEGREPAVDLAPFLPRRAALAASCDNPFAAAL